MAHEPGRRRAGTPRTGAEDDAAPSREYRGRHHTVRPRWAWSGLVLLVVGSVVAGVGIAVVSLPWIVVGGVVVLVGAVAALVGGLLYDIEGSAASLSDEHREVPGSMARAADQDARGTVAGEEAELAAARGREGVRPSLRRPAAGLVLAVALWLVVSQGPFYDQTPTGRDGTYRAVGFAIVLTFPALYLYLVRPAVLALAVCALAGLGLVLVGTLVEHSTTRAAVSETVSGVLVLLGTAVAAQLTKRGVSGGFHHSPR